MTTGTKTQVLNWRAHLPVHPAAELFPLLSEKELKEFAGDIKRNGLKTNIVIWVPEGTTDVDIQKKAQLLDGRNRLDALAMLGLLFVDDHGFFYIKKPDGEFKLLEWEPIRGGNPEKHAYSLNLHRRHLKYDKKRELIARELKEKPEASDRAIAKQLKIVTDKTVSAVRQAMEATAEIPQLKKTVGADGKARKRPAKKPKPDPQQVEARRQARQHAKERRERTAIEIERLASKLIEIDRDTARALYDVLWRSDAERLLSALERGLGLDKDAA